MKTELASEEPDRIIAEHKKYGKDIPLTRKKQQPTTIINETTKQINQNLRVDIDTRIIFKEDTPKSKPRIICPANMSNDGYIITKTMALLLEQHKMIN